jgi:hypothetical protein
MSSLSRPFGFNSQGIAQIGPPPPGKVWTVSISVPAASGTQNFSVIAGPASAVTASTPILATMQGPASWGPVQLRGNQALSLLALNGAPTAPAVALGQEDEEGSEPTGIFPASAGGTTNTIPNPASHYAPFSGTLSPTAQTVIAAPPMAEGQIRLRVVYVGALAGGFEGVVVLQISGPGAAQLAQFSLLQTPFGPFDYESLPLGAGDGLQLYTGSGSISATATITYDVY